MVKPIKYILKKISLLVFLAINMTYSQNYDNDSIKVWSDKEKLCVNDFKEIIKVDTLARKTIFAYSRVTIDYYLNDLNKFHITSIFNKNESFILKFEQTREVLIHEQIHFDILELYARKLRKELLKSYVSNKEISLESFLLLYNKIKGEYIEFVHKYDRETNYSIYDKKQEEWNFKIEFELKSLENFSNENYIERLTNL